MRSRIRRRVPAGVTVGALLIAINQDALGRQGVQVAGDANQRVLAKRLSNDDVAVALFNQSGATRTITTTAAAIGKTGSSFTLTDAWSGATTTTSGTISASVPAHGTAVYRVASVGADRRLAVELDVRRRSADHPELGAGVTQTGAAVTANVAWNGSIAAGNSATFGFLADWAGNNAKPTNFVLNGASCATTR